MEKLRQMIESVREQVVTLPEEEKGFGVSVDHVCLDLGSGEETAVVRSAESSC